MPTQLDVAGQINFARFPRRRVRYGRETTAKQAHLPAAEVCFENHRPYVSTLFVHPQLLHSVSYKGALRLGAASARIALSWMNAFTSNLPANFLYHVPLDTTSSQNLRTDSRNAFCDQIKCWNTSSRVDQSL
jgi:demethoxyubiquinone hydroxylase (CLK1/Coq7/Cat5 family)